MKQNYLKSFFARFLTLLVLALMSTNLAWGDEVTFTGAVYSGKGGSSGSGGNATATIDPITITSTKAYHSSDSEIREYQNGTITVSSSAGKITKIELTSTASGTSSNGPGKLALNTGESGAYSYSEKVGTWTNDDGDDEVVLKATAQFRWTQIVVTYKADANQVAAPSITPSEVKDAYFDPITITLGCETEGAEIHYTTNGDTPTSESTQYNEPFTVSATTTIKAIAIKSGLTNSSVASKDITFGPVFSSLEDLVADENLKSGDVVKVSFENVQITSKGNTYVYLNVKKGENNIEIYSNGNNVPSTWEVGGKLSGTIIAPWQYYTTGAVWELCPTSWEGITYTEPSSEKYNITIDPNIQNGSVAVSGNITQAVEGTTITLVPTPFEHYLFDTWSVYKTDNADVKITVTNNKFTMPAHNVTVSATFTAIPSHEAKFFVNGVQSGETQNVYEGDAVVFPANPAGIGTKKFVGWTQSEIETPTDNAPTFVSSATMGTEDLNFYAVFADATAAQEAWTEITSVPEAGTYAILSASYFMKAEISSSRFANGSATPQISNGKLTTAPAEDCIWEISKPDTYYRIKNGDKYAGGTETKNQGALLTDASADLAKWSINYDNGFTITNYGRSIAQKDPDNKYLRNNTTNGWATYASSTGSAPRLFKKSGGTIYTGYCTIVVVKELSSISVKTAPEKTEYYVDDNFDPTGLVITLNYSDESTEDITYAGNEESFTFNPALDAALQTTNTKVTITYGDKPVDQNITVSVRPIHTVTYYALGTQIGTEQVTEGQTVANAPAAKELTGWTIAGWTENESYTMSNTAPVLFDIETPITEDINLYAVYSKTEGDSPVSFNLNVTSGDFTIASDANYAATAIGANDKSGKISSSTDKADARYYIFTKIEDGKYSILDKTANKYVSYSSSTNFVYADNATADASKWSVTESDGSWIVVNVGTSNRGLIYRAGSQNCFGAYATSNTDAEYNQKLTIQTASSEVTYYTISNPIVTLTGTPGDVHYATYYGTKSMKVDENTTIATCYVENNTIYVNDLEGNVIPANGAVLLHSTGATITLTETTENANEDDVTFIEDKDFNMLFGYTVDTHVDAAANTYYYALNVSDNKAGFFVPRTTDNTSEPSAANGFTAKAGKAYLKVVSALGAKEGFEFGEPTGIESIQTSVINPQSTIYNLNGVRVNGNYKGIVIVNGKKYINK